MGNASSGITLQGDGNLIEGNNVRFNRVFGVFVTGVNNNQVVDNIVSDNFPNGVTVANIADNNLIAGNFIDKNSMHGIYIGTVNFTFGAYSVLQLLGATAPPIGPVGNRIQDNTITTHADDGVHVAGDLDDAITSYSTEAAFEAVDAVTNTHQTSYLDGVIIPLADGENDKCQLFDANFGFDTVPIVDGIYQENLCGTVADLVAPSPTPCDGAALDNSIFANTIYDNGHLGINLSDSQDVIINLGFGALDTFATSVFDGITPNDIKDKDVGANNLQNSPELNFAQMESGGLRVHGRFKSECDKNDRLDFYANPTGT